MEQPQMMTIRQIAKTGILPQYTLRMLVKKKVLPVLYSGKRALIDYNAVIAHIQNLQKGGVKYD